MKKTTMNVVLAGVSCAIIAGCGYSPTESQLEGATNCPELSPTTQQYLISEKSGGSLFRRSKDLPVRCGPQTETPHTTISDTMTDKDDGEVVYVEVAQ